MIDVPWTRMDAQTPHYSGAVWGAANPSVRGPYACDKLCLLFVWRSHADNRP